MTKKGKILPFIPTREILFYPQAVIPIIVGRDFSKLAIDESMEQHEGNIVLSIQKDSQKEEIEGYKDINEIGVVAKIIQIIKLPDGNLRVLIEGIDRVKIEDIGGLKENGYFSVQYELYPVENKKTKNEKKYRMYLEKVVEEVNQGNKNSLPEDILKAIFEVSPFEIMIYTLATTLDLSEEDRVAILESNDIDDMFEILSNAIKIILEFNKIDKSVEDRVKKNIEENQKQYYIREKIKGLYSELDENDMEEEVNELYDFINKRKLPVELKEKLNKELSRLKKLNDMSAEAGVIRSYIESVLEVPWEREEVKNIDIRKAEKILNDEHFGLKQVKDTILENLAVSQLNKNNNKKAPNILCLVGPPGVGKTSLGKSIANAMNREFERISLGGVHDESEIRGHRRTYIGAMPGRIIDSLKKVKVSNPLIILD